MDNPDELLHGVIEVELDLVGRRTDRFVSSELKLRNQILVGVLCESARLVGVKEDIVDIKRGGDTGCVVGNGGGHRGTTIKLSGINARSSTLSVGVATEAGDSPIR